MRGHVMPAKTDTRAAETASLLGSFGIELLEQIAQFRRSRALVPLIPSSHSPIHLEPSVWAPLSAVVRPQICWAVIPREGQAVPVVNRRGLCAPRSDRHESNAAARTGGPC